VATVFSEQAAVLLARKQADVVQVDALRLVARAAVDRQAAAVSAAKSAPGQAAALLAIARINSAKLEQGTGGASGARQRGGGLGARPDWQALSVGCRWPGYPRLLRAGDGRLGPGWDPARALHGLAMAIRPAHPPQSAAARWPSL
jgi:hypothetical protein